jgi:hypothetical protein
MHKLLIHLEFVHFVKILKWYMHGDLLFKVYLYNQVNLLILHLYLDQIKVQSFQIIH